MKKNIIYISWIVFFGLFSCGEEQEKTYEDLAEVEKANLKLEIIDSLRNEMHEYLVEFDSFYEVAFPPCGPYYPIKIELNKKGLVTINDKMATNKIQSSIIKHNTANREKNLENNFPPFHWTYELNQLEKTTRIKSEIKNMKKEGFSSEMIEFKKGQLQRSEDVLKYLNQMNTKNFRTIDDRSYVSLEYGSNDQTNILDSALCSYYELRNFVSKQYFKKSYAEVFYSFKNEIDSVSIIQMNTLKWAYPVMILDIPFMKENNLRNYLIPKREIVPISLPID